jgi:hypothetical protein
MRLIVPLRWCASRSERYIGEQKPFHLSSIAPDVEIMAEVWLKSNRRALAVAAVVPSTLVLAGAFVLGIGINQEKNPFLVLMAGGCLFALGLISVVGLCLASYIPRLAFDDGELLVYLRSLTPLRVPIEVVECFFLGQGPAHPAAPEEPVPKAANVIVRIAESATKFHAREVRADLGQWRDGYITIRGMWCEPLSHERVNALNRHLAEAHLALRARHEVS